jgi:hypothetical protein
MIMMMMMIRRRGEFEEEKRKWPVLLVTRYSVRKFVFKNNFFIEFVI